MTLVDRPLIQYAIDEAREAGISDFIFVTARGKQSLEDYFDSAPELESSLQAKGKSDLLQELQRTNMDSGAIAYVRQREALGLGHAVWCARRLIGDEPFAVLLPDDVIQGGRSCLRDMVDTHVETGGNVVAAMDVPNDKVSSYGILGVSEDDGTRAKVDRMVEKPSVEDAPSNLAVIGRYILTPRVLQNLNRKERGAGNEIQLTDAIAAEIDGPDGVYGQRFEGQRFDCGSKAGYLQATVAFGLSRNDLREELADFLSTLDLDSVSSTAK